jgi:aspartyl/asparaginyl-tRNA synthetase
LAGHAGETVTVAGWVHRRRLLKSVAFLILRDAAGLAQIVTEPAELEKLSEESVVEITESGANVFQLDYFGTPAYPAQSPQFYKQLMVGVFERVYEVGPVFRAEPHDTARHLAQYTSLDAELGFIADHRDVMAVLTSVVAEMVGRTGVEVEVEVTGGQRLHRYEDYVTALGGEVEPYEGYLEGFRFGMPPHGGFAIGLERFVARLTGAANVRQTIAFPRGLHRLTP